MDRSLTLEKVEQVFEELAGDEDEVVVSSAVSAGVIVWRFIEGGHDPVEPTDPEVHDASAG